MKNFRCRITSWALIGFVIISCFAGLATAQTPLPPEISYDIVYVRAPRLGDEIRTEIPEVHTPISMEAGTDLILLHPDGSEETLVTGGQGAVVDPYVSFDGKWVFYAKVHDQTDLNGSRKDAARSGSDIFKINLETRQIIRLTFQEWTPNTGAGNWSNNPLSSDPSGTNYLGYGIYNLGPCPLPNGRLMFTSSRNGFLANKSMTFPNLQLFVMDQDGRNVEEVGHLNLGSALHPTILMDGRVMFSSYEGQGLRDSRVWSLWSIWPDGTRWEPLMSGFAGAFAFHWQAQLSDGSVVVEDYYNANNAGFGSFIKFPASVPPGTIRFGSADPDHASNPPIAMGWHGNGKVEYQRFPFSPFGLESLTPFTIAKDRTAPFINGTGTERTGKVTQPSGAPNNDLLLVWTPGPAHKDEAPVYDAGLYLLAGGIPVHDHRELILIKNDPNYNEQQPRAVLPYQAIYGMAEPQALPWLPNDGSLHHALPEGTPYGLIGTSTFYRRDSKPGEGKAEFNGLEPFNTTDSSTNINWEHQGADAGLYNDDEMYAVRIVALEPTSHLSYGPNERRSHSTNSNWRNHADERMRILGEIPLRKFDASGNVIRDADGNPDTSFLAKIPADVPFTFQTIDKDGLVLNSSQTWHQVRPGEVRHDCGGCHAHSRLPLDFSTTAAALPDYQILDLANSTPLLTKNVDNQPTLKTAPQGVVDVEYYRDIKPILQRSCVQCHSSTGVQEGNLVLDDETIVDKYDNTYHRLANDSDGEYGIPPLVKSGWRGTNASRYIRKFQSRRSLLIWKIFGRRLDGWSNEDHPSAAVPGDPTSLPNGGDKKEINLSDLDYNGTIMPPPGSGIPTLTEDEKILFARWVDMGAPITSQEPERQKVGWFADELRPTLTVSGPKAGYDPNALETIRIGAHDFNTGLDMSSFSVKANFIVNGRPPGTELSGLFQETGDHIWSLQLSPSIQNLSDGQITVRVKDNQGNWSEVLRHFGIAGIDPGPQDTTVPTITAPADVSVTVAVAPAPVDLGLATAVDPESGITSIVSDAPEPPQFAEGTTTVTWTATNGAGLTATATQVVTVTLIQPPTPPVAYFDNFDDGDLSEYGQIGGNWSTVSEAGRGRVLRQTTNAITILYAAAENFSGSYQVQAEIWNEDNDTAGVAFRVNPADPSSFYQCSATGDDGSPAGFSRHVNSLSSGTPLAGGSWTYVRSRWYTVTITVDQNANTLHCQWESAQAGVEFEVTATDPEPLAAGSIGIRLSSEDNFKADRLTVSPLGPPDTIAPEVTLTSPTVTTSTSDFALQFTATDSVGVSECGYFLDGTSTLLPACANTSVTGVALGTHELHVFATDGMGNTGVSPAVVFIVGTDVSRPVWNPAPTNQTLLDGELLSYLVQAVDNVAIAAYAVDDTVNFTMDPATGLLVSNFALPPGSYPLNLSVQDTSGNLLTAPLTVTVFPPTPPVAYFDNFDDGDLSEYGQIGGNWSTVSEAGRGRVLRQTTNAITILYPAAENFSGSYQVQAEIWNEDNDTAGVAFRVNPADPSSFYQCSATGDDGSPAGFSRHVNSLSSGTPLAGGSWTYVRSRWYTVTITVDQNANTLHCQWESAEAGVEFEVTATDPEPLAAGSIGFRLSSEDNFKGDRLAVEALGQP